MTTDAITDSQRKAAKLAGATFLLITPFVVYANFAIHERLVVAGDAAATAGNILANETLFRIGIGCDLIYSAGLLVLVSALYTILKPVDRTLALIAAAWRLVYGLMWLRMTLNLFEALRLVEGAPFLAAFETDRLQSLARLSFNQSFDQYYVGLLFWALASTVCSYLWLKSRYVPRSLALFGVVSSAFAAAITFAFILAPDVKEFVNLWWFDTPMTLFEVALSVWLLVKGLAPAQNRNGTI